MEELAIALSRDLDAAFPRLVMALQDPLYSGVRRLVPQHADAEDICAEAFLRAYRAMQKMTQDAIAAIQLRPWMWTIALNLCRNAARRRSRKPWVTLDPEWMGGAVADDFEAIVAADGLAAMVDALPQAQRTSLVLRHIVGLTYDEIASITRRNAGTVKSDVSRALARLRTQEVA